MTQVATSEVVLDIRNLNVGYHQVRGTLRAVENLNLSLRRGKVLGVIGESGSGKSTIAKAILGTLPPNAEVSESSEIIFDGVNVLKLSEEELRQFRWHKASMVFQAAQNALNPMLRIEEQMLDVMYDHLPKLDLSSARDKIRRLLEMLHLDPDRVMRSYPHQLSGGMRQRVVIAMALVLDPELVILDEPTTALDVITQFYIFDILSELHEKLNLTMMLITHDISLASKISDEIAVMYGGFLVEHGPASEMLKKPKHPYTEGLLNSLPRIEGDNISIKPIPGFPPDLIDKPMGCIFHPRCSKRLDICDDEKPQLVEVSSSWRVACHLYSSRGEADGR